MMQQKTRKTVYGRLFPRALVWGLALGLLLLPVTGLRSSLVLDAGTVYASSLTGPESESILAAPPEGAVCPTDMVAYWKLEEPNGASGYADFLVDHPGACSSPTNCPLGWSGQVGNAQKFNGTNRAITVPSHADFDWQAADSFSVEAWIRRPISTLDSNEVVVGQDYSPGAGTPRHWWLGINKDGKAAFTAVDSADGSVGSVVGVNNLMDDVWHHLLAVRDADGGRLVLYVDGQFVRSVDAAYEGDFASPKGVNIGWIDFGAGYHFDGLVDEVALYRRALTAGEAERHWSAGVEHRGYCSAPQIVVDKLADRQTIHAGTTVEYTYLVSNPGDVSLEGVYVLDDRCSPVTYVSGDSGNDQILEPANRETWIYTCSVAVNADTTNTATAAGTYSYPQQGNISGTDTATVNVLAPQVTVAKAPDNSAVYAGDTVLYTYTTTNTSNDDLTNLQIVDDKCAPVTRQTGDGTLSGGESQTYRCSATLTEDTTNVATLTGTDALGESYLFTGSATVDVIAPDVEVVKTASAQTIYSNEWVTYTYRVTNNGSDVLSSVRLTDDKCAPVTLVGSNADGSLQPGETLNYTCSTILLGDTTNTGTFAGVDVLGKTWTFTDTATVHVLGPQIRLVKTANPAVITAPGGPVRFDFSVTNPGNVPLSNVRVNDSMCTPAYVSGDANGNNRLDLTETWLFRCSVSVSADTTNTATATGVDSQGKSVVSPPASATVDVIGPGIGLDKSAEKTQIDIGATAVYRYAVSNAGDDPLSNITVTDDKCSPVTYVSGDANHNNKLDVTETWIYTCSMVLNAKTTNTASAAGDDSASPPGRVRAQDSLTVNVGSVAYLPLVLGQR